MQLKEALVPRRGEMVSLIGPGGKTTTMFRLAHELREDNWKVLVSTTTKIFKPSKPHVDRLFLVDNEDFIVEIVQHPAGCWKGIPTASQKVAVINQVDAPQDVAPATALGKKLLACGAHRVVLTSYTSEDPVREVLLH